MMTSALMIHIENTIADRRSERGAAMAEYGLLLGLVALAAIGILVLFGGEIAEVFAEAENVLDLREPPPADGPGTTPGG